MMTSRIEILNIYIIAKVFCKCAGYLTFVMPMVLMYFQISKKVSAVSNNPSLNMRKLSRSNRTSPFGLFGGDFCKTTFVITPGNYGRFLALGRLHMLPQIASSLSTPPPSKIYRIKFIVYNGGTITNISMMHTKEMILKYFCFKNSLLYLLFPMMQSHAMQPMIRTDG